LALGKAETTTPLPQFFRPFDHALKIYQRVGERVTLPPTPLRATMPAGAAPAFLRGSHPTGTPRLLPPADPPLQARDAIATYIGGASVGVVVVDRNYDIVAINLAARTMLQIHGVGVGSDFIHLLGPMGATFRGMIDAVLGGATAEPEVLLAQDPVTGLDRWLQISCYTERAAAAFGQTVGIVIADVTRYEARLHETERAATRADEVSERLKAVLAANDELSIMNADLRTYNEHLLINAEEAASANEEIETLNEEMQATNEELETLNEELQATVEELNTTNDELESRSADLERANSATQAQVDTSEARRRVLETALRRLAPLFAITDGDGNVSAASPDFPTAEGLSEVAGRWWQNEQEFEWRGNRYRVHARPLDEQDHALLLVTLQEIS